MDFTKNLDLYLDPKIIFDIYPMWVCYLALLGFLFGLITAYISWYRSARRIAILEKVRDELRAGDIEIKNIGETSLAKPKPVTQISTDTVKANSDRVPTPSWEPFVDDGFPIKDVYSVKPADADDLTLLEGIDDDRAKELNGAGIYKFSQLQGLDEEGRRKIGFKFGWQNINWGAWEAIAAGTGFLLGREIKPELIGECYKHLPEVATFDQPFPVQTSNMDATLDRGIEEGAENPKREDDFELPAVYTSATNDTDDLTQLEKIGEGEIILTSPMVDAEAHEDDDDLTQLVGIDKEKAKVLGKSGIFEIPQMPDLNEEQLETDGKQFSFPDLNLGELAGPAAPGAGLVSAIREEVDEEEESRLQIPQVASPEEVGSKVSVKIPEDADDFTLLEGIDDEKAAELHRAGIHKFCELENLNEEQRDALSEKFSFNDFNWGKWSELAGLVAGGGLGASLLVHNDKESQIDLSTVYTVPPDDADDFTRLEGINEEKAAELRRAGIYKFSQLAELSDDERERFSRKFKLSELIWGELPAVMQEGVPEDVQITTISPAKLKGSLSNETQKIQLPVLNDEGANSDWRWGYTFREKPIHTDDLTKLEGISSEDAARLNSEGVYTFRQLENLPEEKREEVKSKFGWGDIDWGKWADSGAVSSVSDVVKNDENATEQNLTISSAGLSTFTVGGFENSSVDQGFDMSEVEPERPGTISYSETLGSFEGEDVEINENLGVVYTGLPPVQDDLKRIRGIGKSLENQLNSRGVYRFKQISNWNTYNVWAFGKDLAIPGRINREQWVPQASELAELEDYKIEAEELVKTKFGFGSVKVDPELGIVYRKKPEVVDDLTQLPGIDSKAESRLNSDGIFTFDQVNGLKGAQRKFFASRFGLGDIDWTKWSGISALGAKKEDVVSNALEIKNVLVKPKLEPKDRAEIVESDDLPTEDPKGIFGSAEDFERVFGGKNGKPEDRRVVFIMDVSRSLTPAQLRLSKTELSMAVCALPEGTLYQVIFFSGPTWFAHQRMVVGGARGEDVVIADGAMNLRWNSGFGGFEYEDGNTNLPSSEWREANPKTISATLADIEAVGKSYGTTWHLPLTMALNLEPVPKCIYFLTDGETARQDQVAEEIVEMARERGGATQINTIALMVPGASVPLYRIAKGTGGEYSLVIAGGKVLKDDDLREYLLEKGIVLDD